jgi:hypothetical protein
VRRPSVGGVVLGACVAGALALAASLVTVQTSAPEPPVGLGTGSGFAAYCAAPDADSPLAEQRRAQVRVWLPNEQQRTRTIDSIVPLSSAGLAQYDFSVEPERGGVENGGGIVERYGKPTDGVPGDDGHPIVVPAHGGVWITADVVLAPGAGMGWIGNVAVRWHGALDTRRSEILPVVLGITSRTWCVSSDQLEESRS